jgi:hypothetical protein
VQQTSLSTTGTQRVLSCFVKAGTNNYVQLGFGASVTAYANFDVTSGAGAVGTVGATATASIVDAGNGWFRCIAITSDATASALCFIAIIQSSTDTRLQSFVAAGTETIILWGAQLEQRSAVTAYTPTTTQPITNYIPVLQTAASGVARFDHNPTTFESLGLLIEEQRTNLLTYSEQFDNAAWSKTNTPITSNANVAPDGTLTADLSIPTTATNNKLIQQNFTYTAGTKYTASVYAKIGGYNRIRLAIPGVVIDGGAERFATFILSTGSIVSGFDVEDATITPVGNGWYRCSITQTTTTGGASTLRLYVANDSSAVSFAGDGYSGIFIWGAQLESSSFSTSYIPTVASQVTRSADAASMTGTNFSSWFNQQQGSLYLDTTPRQTGTQYPAIIGDGTTATLGIGFFTDVGNLQARVRGTGGSSTITGSIAITANTAFKAMLSYAAYNNAWAYNGANRATGNTNIKPENSVNLRIGSDPVGNNVYTGTIKKLSFYPVKLTDAEMNALTS